MLTCLLSHSIPTSKTIPLAGKEKCVPQEEHMSYSSQVGHGVLQLNKKFPKTQSVKNALWLDGQKPKPDNFKVMSKHR